MAAMLAEHGRSSQDAPAKKEKVRIRPFWHSDYKAGSALMIRRFDQGRRIVEPVVRRAAASSCARAASRKA